MRGFKSHSVQPCFDQSMGQLFSKENHSVFYFFNQSCNVVVFQKRNTNSGRKQVVFKVLGKGLGFQVGQSSEKCVPLALQPSVRVALRVLSELTTSLFVLLQELYYIQKCNWSPEITWLGPPLGQLRRCQQTRSPTQCGLCLSSCVSSCASSCVSLWFFPWSWPSGLVSPSLFLFLVVQPRLWWQLKHMEGTLWWSFPQHTRFQEFEKCCSVLGQLLCWWALEQPSGDLNVVLSKFAR